MKKIFCILGLVLTTPSALAQGTINFNNRVTGQIDAPFFVPGFDTGLGVLSASAQLFKVTGTPGSETYTPIGQATKFRAPTAANPLLAAYITPIPSMVVDGVAPGSQITVVLRASSASYYTAGGIYQYSIQSNPVTITLGGRLPSGEELPPANLVGLVGATILGPLPPMFFSVSRQTNQLNFSINPFFQAQSYALESSTDFVTWTPVLTNQTQHTLTVPFQSSGAQQVYFRTRTE